MRIQIRDFLNAFAYMTTKNAGSGCGWEEFLRPRMLVGSGSDTDFHGTFPVPKEGVDSLCSTEPVYI
jgi:hypothetical protein